MQSFEASLKIVFAVLSMKECMPIMLLLDLFNEKWKEILLLWKQGKILDKYGNFFSKP